MVSLFPWMVSFFSSDPGEFVRVGNDPNRLNLPVLHIQNQNEECFFSCTVGFLHQILGIHRTPKHPVGDGKQVGSVGFKGFHAASRFSLSLFHLSSANRDSTWERL